MPDEKKKKSRVVRGEDSCHVEGSGAAPNVVVSRYDQFPPDTAIVREAIVNIGDVRRRVDDEGTEADDESEIISVGGPLSIVGGCESEGFTFEEAVGRAGLISEMDTSTLTNWEEWSSAYSISSLNCVGIRISVHNCVVFPIPARILGSGSPGVNVSRSWW